MNARLDERNACIASGFAGFAWTGFARFAGFACNVLMQVTCNSDFLNEGEEMHLICRFASIAFPLSPVPRFPRFPLFRLVRVIVQTVGHMAGNRPVGPR